ncbi:MAG: hypothetical protein AVDCRST_MAG74-1229 [uncultured Pyrinomonadaceae bacterium]|uniref:Uncharacterized protein n=1 Tax=uncultured Pyrinomonadaceae bacterium TaxID=2283094 RepID=A0A6J4NXG6_9BACT|nr:MAG: hypothetical protein AVDCRST_MAG74-1229 [uncultured Pyrinomonadaceae bacterium]
MNCRLQILGDKSKFIFIFSPMKSKIFNRLRDLTAHQKFLDGNFKRVADRRAFRLTAFYFPTGQFARDTFADSFMERLFDVFPAVNQASAHYNVRYVETDDDVANADAEILAQFFQRSPRPYFSRFGAAPPKFARSPV